MNTPLLEVRDLDVRFYLSERTIYAVNGVSFTVEPGQVVGIVGESGCGKSVTSLAIMRLIQEPGRIDAGEVQLHEGDDAVNLLKLSTTQMEHVRGNRISMIFQDPMTSLNPVLTIGYQLMEPLKLHRGLSTTEAREEAIRLLARVGIPEPEGRLKEYAHQYSGGMRQRVMIAMAVACSPDLLIADEPTTSLDVTIQAQILDLLLELQHDLGTAVIIITHDLGVIAEVAEKVVVMYAGTVVETGPVKSIFSRPEHPYTQALMFSIPPLHASPERLETIAGAPPQVLEPLTHCPFEPRCPLRIARCAEERPRLLDLTTGHACACWVVQGGKGA
ncbi:MAG: ABC transporter ATP-binding protein [Anaerolineae bacterium]|nr:ABC transporter ATP-binding protein [Anaerolineae bacterium]